MNPHIRLLQIIALIGIILGVVLTIVGLFNYRAGVALPIGVGALSIGVLALLLAATASAITWKPDDK